MISSKCLFRLSDSLIIYSNACWKLESLLLWCFEKFSDSRCLSLLFFEKSCGILFYSVTVTLGWFFKRFYWSFALSRWRVSRLTIPCRPKNAPWFKFKSFTICSFFSSSASMRNSFGFINFSGVSYSDLSCADEFRAALAADEVARPEGVYPCTMAIALSPASNWSLQRERVPSEEESISSSLLLEICS